GRDDRPDRRARVHRPPAQPTAGGPVMTTATPPRRAARSRRPLLAVASAGLLLFALVLVRVLVGEPMVPIDLALRVLKIGRASCRERVGGVGGGGGVRRV